MKLGIPSFDRLLLESSYFILISKIIYTWERYMLIKRQSLGNPSFKEMILYIKGTWNFLQVESYHFFLPNWVNQKQDLLDHECQLGNPSAFSYRFKVLSNLDTLSLRTTSADLPFSRYAKLPNVPNKILNQKLPTNHLTSEISKHGRL